MFEDAHVVTVFLLQILGQMGGNSIDIFFCDDIFSIELADEGEELTLFAGLVQTERADDLVRVGADRRDEGKSYGFFG